MLLKKMSIITAWEYGQKLFNDNHKENEMDLFNSYCNYLNTFPKQEAASLLIQAIILYGNEKQILLHSYEWRFYPSISFYTRNSYILKTWLFNTKLNLNQWIFIFKNDIFLLESSLHVKLLRDMENNILDFLSNIKDLVWFQHYNDFWNFLISNQILLNEKPIPLISNIDDFIITEPGRYKLKNNVIGYKILNSRKQSIYIAQVMIPSNSIIIVPNNENKLRCNHYIIKEIWNKQGTTRKYGYGPIYHKYYQNGSDVKIHNLDMDLNEICTTGLHFYSSFDEALKSEYVHL